MLELFICSLLTVLPDYLIRRYVQGKRIGKDITIYSVWFELRWGITACIMLTVLVITVIFYYHPATNNVTAYFRTVPIISEVNGRVSEVYVRGSAPIAKGAPIFKLESTRQEAALDSARKNIEQVNARLLVARTDIAVADGQVQQAKGALEQAQDELRTKQDLRRRNADVVATREIERLENMVETRQGGVAAAQAAREAAELKVSTLLPAEKASAEAALASAQVDLDKTTIYAGVSGRIEQFALQVGDIVNPFARPAGVLIPGEAGRGRLFAGFGQIEAQVMKVGMTAEVTCISKPMTVIPMVVTQVQDYIAAGQFRATDQLADAQQVRAPGSITVTLEPMFEGGLDGVTPGSSCVANAYTSNHEALADKNISTARWLFLHGVDATAAVHAIILRAQSILLPIRVLVLSGH